MFDSKIGVEYISHMGDDVSVVNAARISFNTEKTELDNKDKKLIKYLADHEHMSPFEHCTISVKVKVPLFIRSQIMRHRTFSYNEISRRYTSKDLEFYIPKSFRKQAKDNRQASDGIFNGIEQKALTIDFKEHVKTSLKFYNDLLDFGVSREQARAVLPQNLYTEFIMTGNLRNWVHFIKLRDHEGAQHEARAVAQKVREILLDKFGYAALYLLQEKE